MKIIQLILISFLFFFHSAYSQNENLQDVIYLKNGSIIRGLIIEQVPNKSLKIKTADNSVFVYVFEEIEKITKEETSVPITETKKSSPETNLTSVSEKDSALKRAFRSIYLSKSYFGIEIGGSFPTGDYGDSENTNSNGFAKQGFCFIFKGNINLIKYLGLAYSIGGNMHFFDNIKYESLLQTNSNQRFDFNSNPHISYFALIGPALKLPLIDQLIIEFSPELGFMGSISPFQRLSTNQLYSSNGLSYDWVHYSTTTTEAQNKFGFAYQIDIGLRINLSDGFAVKLGFNYLESKITFDQEYNTEYYYGGLPKVSGTRQSNELIYKSKNPYIGFLFLL